ncbi:MAG: hypothetical protein HY917_05265, partial [Candidatus Diapherotrites archaeon]|nr:hypothetical protein [Candidatus Diapherotrites archaeon]
MKLATAVSPAHMTGLFKIYANGSTGAGISLENGMKTTVQANPAPKNKITIFINGKKASAPTSRTVAETYLKKTKQKFTLTIRHSTKFPIGFGLGISGSGALSLSLALNHA